MPSNGDYRLSDYSPAIGAGTDAGAPTTDIEGNPRPNPAGSNPDMGAYESSLGAPAHNPFIYVATTGEDVGSVGVMDIPFKTIQAAINYAVAGDTVLIEEGTYVENVTLGKDIVLGSRYLKTPELGYIENTVIDGDSVGTVLTISDTRSSAVVAGLTLQNGFSTQGGGLNLSSTSGTVVRNMLIIENVATDGGGVYATGTSKLLDVEIMDNNAAQWRWSLYIKWFI